MRRIIIVLISLFIFVSGAAAQDASGHSVMASWSYFGFNSTFSKNSDKSTFGTGMLLGVLACASALIAFLWQKTGKFNTAAVLIGAVGYLMLYVSLITLSVEAGRTIPVILYVLAICLFVFLCLVGILANLKDAKVHWVIEISNVTCQLSVAVATTLLFL